MLLESRINDRLTLVIDCETVGGIDKGTLSVTNEPDAILANAVTTIRAVAAQLGEAALVDATVPPSSMEVCFGVRVDSNAVVSLARAPDNAQLRVTLRWVTGPG